MELDIDDTFAQQARAEAMPEAHLRELDDLNHKVRGIPPGGWGTATTPPFTSAASVSVGMPCAFLLLPSPARGPTSTKKKIVESLQAIHAAKRKRDFMTTFATHPAAFINAWIDAQSRDLKVAALACVGCRASVGLGPAATSLTLFAPPVRTWSDARR